MYSRAIFCNNTKRGSLTHDGATSNAASSPQDSPGSVDVLSEGLRFSVCSSRLIYCLVPQEQERIVLVWESLRNGTLIDGWWPVSLQLANVDLLHQ